MKIKKINIIYICITEKGPSGGGKIIYKHSDVINKLGNQFSSQVLHVKKKRSRKWIISLSKIFTNMEPKYSGWKFNDITVKKNYKSKWFNSNINIKNDFNFDTQNKVWTLK